MSRKFNQTVNRGTTFPISVFYNKGNEPASLVGATVYFTAKSVEYDTSAGDTTAVISKTVTSHTNAPNGETAIILSASDTWVNPGAYNYDIVVKEANGDVYEIAEGILTVDGGPTNRSAQ